MIDINSINIPNSLESARLKLIAPDVKFSSEINHAILESWESLNKWMPWAQVKPSVSETEAAWKNFVEEWNERKSFNMLILKKKDSRFLGVCGFPRLDWKVPKFEIGYWLRDSEVSNGYMREAVKVITKFAFSVLQAKRIEIICDSRNEKSIRVAESLRFTREANIKNHCRTMEGGLRDTLIYGLTEDPF